MSWGEVLRALAVPVTTITAGKVSPKVTVLWALELRRRLTGVSGASQAEAVWLEAGAEKSPCVGYVDGASVSGGEDGNGAKGS